MQFARARYHIRNFISTRMEKDSIPIVNLAFTNLVLRSGATNTSNTAENAKSTNRSANSPCGKEYHTNDVPSAMKPVLQRHEHRTGREEARSGIKSRRRSRTNTKEGVSNFSLTGYHNFKNPIQTQLQL